MMSFYYEGMSFILAAGFLYKLLAVSQVKWENKLQKPRGSAVLFFTCYSVCSVGGSYEV
ncbi:hypothetical protein I6J18_06900 [Peribacillus psychrosaccharolyticus]|uniref:Uncharacterized protein n=2 Tax=Peribacillus psychrosaccharolyticus TaxID=1407 RepID=A0A974S2P3_PERPY|nr:hypothetical protein [Peribacillus psychrosaccharolyticus]QQT01585.1 hypothetical protein I6J18_06900 [Peribacillus psychrosaccharolyticus]